MISAGKYTANIVGGNIQRSEQGSLMFKAIVNVKGDTEDVYGYLVLIKKDGEVNQRNVDNLKKMFPQWDGVDPFWLEDHLQEIANTDIRVTVENEDYQGKPRSKIKWFNALSDSGGAPTAAADRAAILAAYGAKLRAAAGKGSDYKPPATAPVPAPATAPVVPVVTGTPCTQEQAWGLFEPNCPIGWTDTMRTDHWFKCIAQLIPSKNPVAFDNNDWGKIASNCLAWIKQQTPF